MHKHIHVLMIEDNPGDVELVQALLEEESGDDFKVSLQVISDGKEATAYINAARHRDMAELDLILLDLNLPNASGREVLSVIKSHGVFSHLPIIIMSELATAKDIQAKFPLPDHCFIPKPIGLMQMLEVMNHYTWSVTRVRGVGDVRPR